ncbi:MAG: DUF3800 domain-containing protein [Anaerolineales bacterium]
MIDQAQESALLQSVDDFRTRRGLLRHDGASIEVKWQKVEDEWKQARKLQRRNRYEELLGLFFEALAARRLSFGYMFLKSSEYKRVKASFQETQPGSKHNFFFMLYFQFLYHCFIRTHIKGQPCQIFIDNRNMGSEGSRYDLNKLKDILNRRLYRDATPRNQPALAWAFRKRMTDSIQLVNLAESKQEPLIQLSDLCAGCVRYALENQVQAPPPQAQLPLLAEEPAARRNASGRSDLTAYFYQQLRSIDGYNDINLLKVSRHHRFSIFPFEFRN